MSVLEMLTGHVFVEEKASRIYRHLANWAERASWVGIAKFFRKEAAEELEHSNKFQDYVLIRGGAVPMDSLPSVPEIPKSPLEAFDIVRRAEIDVLNKILAISAAAKDANDWDTVRFLHEFTEAGTKQIDFLRVCIDQLARAENNAAALLFFDHEIGEGD